jgi:uncharacterized protein
LKDEVPPWYDILTLWWAALALGRTRMRVARTVDEVRNAALPILIRHGITRAGVFGSCARGELTADSDIDILVEIRGDISLLDFIRVKQEVEEALGQEVDLVEYDAIKPLMRERILNEQVSIL